MAKSTGTPKDTTPKIKRRQAPGKTIDARENQIIRLAYDEAERRIRNKTDTSQEIVHFLKTGSVIAQLEKAKLEKENELLKAKTESLQSQKRVEELYANAMKAFRTYSGQEESTDEDD